MHVAACYLVKQIQWQMSSLTSSFEQMLRVRKGMLLWDGGEVEVFFHNTWRRHSRCLCASLSPSISVSYLLVLKTDTKATFCFLNALLKEKQTALELCCIRSGNKCSQMYPGISLWTSGIITSYTCVRLSFVLHTCKQILVERSCALLNTKHWLWLSPIFLTFPTERFSVLLTGICMKPLQKSWKLLFCLFLFLGV